MNKFQNTTPHFFQPLIPGFDSNVSIPKTFHKFLEGEKDGKDTVTLRDRKNGRSWDVKVDDKMQFKQGWNKFCTENELQIGDFLVFRHFSTFDYSPQVELQRDASNANAASGDEMLNEALGWYKVSFKPRGLPYCHLVVKNYSFRSSQMPLPKDFAKENGLNKKSDMVLLDTKGCPWPMQIRLHSSGGALSLDVGSIF